MAGRETLVIRKAQVEETLSMADYVTAVEDGFRRLGVGRVQVPSVVHIPAPNGAFHVKSAKFDSAPSYVAVKVNGNFPNNPTTNGLPTIQGAIVLCDGDNGSLLAVIDSIAVTAMRTGAATAVAAKYLAAEDANSVTVIGCGVQARPQLLALIEVLPLEVIYAFDTDKGRQASFVEQMRGELSQDVVGVEDFTAGTLESRIVVTCTSSRKPFLKSSHVRPGTFIAAVGADNHDKQELDAALMRESMVIADVLTQCAEIGELHHALEAGVMTIDDVYGELGAIVARDKRVQFEQDDIVIFDSTGSAIQDVAAAGIIYERARAGGTGLSVVFA